MLMHSYSMVSLETVALPPRQQQCRVHWPHVRLWCTRGSGCPLFKQKQRQQCTTAQARALLTYEEASIVLMVTIRLNFVEKQCESCGQKVSDVVTCVVIFNRKLCVFFFGDWFQKGTEKITPKVKIVCKIGSHTHHTPMLFVRVYGLQKKAITPDETILQCIVHTRTFLCCLQIDESIHITC